MTVLGRYLAAASQPDIFEATNDSGSAIRLGSSYDEFAAPDGTVRSGWLPLVEGLDEFAETDLVHAQTEVARLLADDGVTYTPSPTAAVSIADDPAPGLPGPGPGLLAEPRRWELDPVPLVLEDREWSRLEAGLVQRAELLDAILADLYGAQHLLADGHVPAAAVLDHEEFLRPLVDPGAAAAQRLFLAGVDLGRDGAGAWKVISDRTQAPSGAGFAMQNRRVVSRVLPEIYHAAHLHRLTPFFHAMRAALLDAAPKQVEDPRVVVLSPGTHSGTAFDQAFVASLLGFPLLEGSDLTVRDGRVWMRVLGKLEQVDVILRRVDSSWTDPLELRPRSRLGVTGLVECVRQGTVSVVNNLGSGALENPALLPLLPSLCERLLGEPLRLPSVDTWWCGEPAARDHVLSRLDDLVVRPISRGAGRSVVGAALTAAQRETLTARIRAAPHRFVGQELLQLSSAPTSDQDRLVARTVVLRAFAVRHGSSWTAMLGGLGKVNDETVTTRGPLVTTPDGVLAKDVWVVAAAPFTEPPTAPRVRADGVPTAHPVATSAAMVPRVLSDLYWFGRYAERAEDLLRLVLATRTVAIETDLDTGSGEALSVLLAAVTHVSTAYPGFLADQTAIWPELRAMVLDRHRLGTAAQALGALSMAAQGVRDQLSEDVWMVLAEVERALAALAANPYDQGLQLTDASERVLAGLLALAGIVSENMVRDPGWYLLDVGRGLERALQVVALLRVTICTDRDANTDRLVQEAVLTAAESIVTFRRRYRGRAGVDAVVELLVTDPYNPRSVAYQLRRIRHDLHAMPNTSPTARPLRLADGLAETVRTVDHVALTTASNGRRRELETFLTDLKGQLRRLSEAVRDQYQQQPPTQQALRSLWTAQG
jgi:uncharacterized circularly permuted ATP-grasp superfamily protein/uncharacterized alpha-E superfamily protein